MSCEFALEELAVLGGATHGLHWTLARIAQRTSNFELSTFVFATINYVLLDTFKWRTTLPSVRPITYARYSGALRRRLLRALTSDAEPSRTPPKASPKVRPKTPGMISDPRTKLSFTGEDLHPRESEFGQRAILESLALLTNFWYLDDRNSGMIRVVNEASNSASLLDAVLAVAYKNDFFVEVRRHRTLEVVRANVRRTHEIFDNEKKVRLVLWDKRSTADAITVSVEAWRRTAEGDLASPDNNFAVSRIWQSSGEEHGDPVGATPLETFLPAQVSDIVQFDVDWVFSWVNGDDADWKGMFAQWAPEIVSDAVDRSRFETRDDLKYALRALEQFAPWIRQIYVLTNCKPPHWLDTSNPRIRWVDHSEVLDSQSLPTFSSHAIETALHKIPGLSKHFVYSNDDFFLVRPTTKADFFYSNGIARVRLESYGMVNGRPRVGDPDYLNAARNSAQLLERDFGVTPVRLHTHSPQSMNREVLEEMEERYSDGFVQTRANRFRDVSDISVTGFLYHHYAFATGRAVPSGDKTRLIQQNHNFKRLFGGLLESRRTGKYPPILSACINDGRGSAENAEWGSAATSFLNGYFPSPSQFEVGGMSSQIHGGRS